MNNNEFLKLPVTFRFSRIIKISTIIVAVAVIFIALMFIFVWIKEDHSTFKKIVPFIILFLGFDSLYKNLFSLDAVIFSEEKITFSYIAKKNVHIKYSDILKIESRILKTKYFIISYKIDNLSKTFIFPMSFPQTIDIMNYIQHFASHIELDEFTNSLMFKKL
jgi:hypothetical protein